MRKNLVNTILIILITTSVILAVLNINAKPHIRYIQISGGSENSEVKNVKLTVFFNNPILKQDSGKPVEVKKYIK